jgi:hypothetical protein
LKKTVIFIFLFILILSCEEKNSELPLARVNDVFLKKSDFISDIPLNLPVKDSSIFVNNYIHDWLTNHLIVNKANEMIPSKVKDVEKKNE